MTVAPAVSLLFAGEPARLADTAMAAGHALRAELGAAASVHVLLRLAEDPTRAQDDGRAGEAGFEAGITITCRDALSEDLTTALAAVVGEHVRRADSAVIVGQAHQVLAEDPDTALLLLLALRRLPHLTHEQAVEHWLHKHAPLALELMPGLRGYRQLHADIGATTALCQRLDFGHDDFDGTASIGFLDLAEFAAVMSRPEIAETALEDEKRFVDHSRSRLGLYRLA
ncbi:EthD domain-containing protein [Allokutzneria sp. NRRL B-24872]|uniref:EthD domain-containing protein n=1 Tax=Allokutzneria sp. NRRL B-24872 TaxID=1137961 RepID=UPI00143D548E|nr:EthD domain-containing protein [Allokutzneria sp. NRRL B-24872]